AQHGLAHGAEGRAAAARAEHHLLAPAGRHFHEATDDRQIGHALAVPGLFGALLEPDREEYPSCSGSRKYSAQPAAGQPNRCPWQGRRSMHAPGTDVSARFGGRVAANSQDGALQEQIMTWQERITLDPEVLAGKPVIRNTRLSVDFVVGL